MDQLISYLKENLILDFQGDLSLEQVREFLGKDENPVAKALMTKLTAEGGVSEMMIVLADCLQETIASTITPDLVREQLAAYGES